MTGDKVINLLMSRLGARTDAITRASCLLEMELAQTRFESEAFLPWFLLSEDATVNTVADERRIEVPADFLREHDDGHLFVLGADGKYTALAKGDYDTLLNDYGFDGTGEYPEAYSLVGDYFALFPIPTQIVQLRLSKYFARDVAPLDEGTENKWLKHVPQLLLADTGLVMASQHLRDADVIQMFSAQRTEAYQALMNFNTAREEANRTREMD